MYSGDASWYTLVVSTYVKKISAEYYFHKSVEILLVHSLLTFTSG